VLSHFDLARKDCVGTARNRTSRVWYTVTDGQTFTDLQSRDTTYLTDPARNSVVVRARLTALQGPRGDLKVYVRVDPTIGGNGGGGTGPDQNAGADNATLDAGTGALVSYDTNTVTAAANRDYAVPTYLAVRADRAFLQATSGYVGSPSDGLVQLDQDHALTTFSRDAPGGNVVQTASSSPVGRRSA